MVNVTTSGPFLDYNSNDHTALVVIVTVFFCLLMVMVMVAKVFIRRNIGVPLQDFDVVLFLAASLMVAQTICIVCASDPGIGKHLTDVSDVDTVRKFQYAASLLAVAATTCTKVSISLLIKRINNYGRVRLANKAILGLVLASFVSTSLASALKCPLPHPWTSTAPPVCPGAVPVYLYSGITSVVTDLQLCILAVAMVWDIKMNLKNRYIVIALFAFRVLCPATTIPALFHTDHLFQRNDFTWLAAAPTIWLQISYNLSVITACIPSMKNIFDSLSGNFSAAIDVPYNLATMTIHNSGCRATTTTPRGLDNNSGGSGKEGGPPGTGSSRSTTTVVHVDDDRGLRLTPAHPSRTSCYTSDGVHPGAVRSRDDDGQSESVRKLTGGVVVVTEEVDIQFENRPSSTDGSLGSWDDPYRHVTGS